MFTKTELRKAYKHLNSELQPTPLVPSVLSKSGMNVYLKLESSQPTKSFKLRGALYKMMSLTKEDKKQGVVTISSGNHGIAVSYAANLLGITSATVIVPVNTPASKCEKILHYGARLIKLGKNYDQAHELGMEYIRSNGGIYIDSYDLDPIVYYGQGTVAMEIIDQLEDVDVIIAPIGGGGLITGIGAVCKAFKPSVKVIGVQTESCPAYKASLDDNTCYHEYPSASSLCEALVGGIGQLAYDYRHLVDDIIIVTEDEIKEGIKHMILSEKIVAEPSSCVVIAAILHHVEKIIGHNIALVISGSNIDEHLILSSLQNK